MSVTGGCLCHKMKGLKLNKLFPQQQQEERHVMNIMMDTKTQFPSHN